jgi:putative molybdopterin biosynthesis protein
MSDAFHRLITLQSAVSIALSSTLTPRTEVVPIERALGRVLAVDVVSGLEVPGFDRASMDGYAVLSDDTLFAREDHPVRLKLCGDVPIGSATLLEVKSGNAAYISTGSVMPRGADAVVMIENCEQSGEAVLVFRAVHERENVQAAGSDISLCEEVLQAGTLLTPPKIGVLAALGHDEVMVRNLLVGVASTGNELVRPGCDLQMGKIYDINSYTIASSVKECGASPLLYGILPDDRGGIVGAIEKIAGECDLALISGSTSAGAMDMLFGAVQEVGRVMFHGINLKPGKPTIFGHVRSTPILGLPGYPTSALTVFRLLAAPMIEQAMGTWRSDKAFSARLARSVRSEGRRQMLAVGVRRGLVYPVDRGSGSIRTLSAADGVIDIPSSVEYIREGSVVQVHPFGPVSKASFFINGEDCPAVREIAETLPFKAEVAACGSSQGMLDVQDGLADIAPISSSVFSSTEGSMQFRLPDVYAVIRGYCREIGMVAASDDLLDDLGGLSHVRVAGWSKNSEMSGLTSKLVSALSQFDGYVKMVGQAKTHNAVAATVARGYADIGFCTKSPASRLGLSWKGKCNDHIDFVVSKGDLDNLMVKEWIEALRRKRSGDADGIVFGRDSGTTE